MVLDAVERLGLDADFCAGHSLGEYTALTATGALGVRGGVRLVCERAEAMHDAGIENPGTMAAVLGLDDDQVEIACNRADSDVWVANFNAPGQVVIAGSPEGVAGAGVIAKELGRQEGDGAARVGRVPHPVHGAGARSVAQSHRRCATSATPRSRPCRNVDALPHDKGSEWASLLSAQLVQPGSLAPGLLRLADAGVTDFVELGPGGVLSGMAKRTVTSARTISVATPEDLDKLLDFVGSGLVSAHPRSRARHLFATERLVVSPAAGVFTPVDDLQPKAP